ncbi:DUF4190 domain-containing protein [Ornithinimicrobium sp. Arc0846-15]|nr:DUF4190 domain-containing protein [Ornithinimicrobium laminariae]
MSTPSDDNPYSSPNPDDEQPTNPDYYGQEQASSADQQFGAPQYGQAQYDQTQYGQQRNYMAPAVPPGNTAGVVALVAGIVGFVICPFVAGIVAIVYGRKSQKLVAAGEANNAPLGTIGFWLGVINVVLSVLVTVFILVIFTGLIVAGTSSV